MEYQKPAFGIVQTMDYDDLKSYTVSCTCHNPDDNITFDVEIDTDTNEIIVNTYVYSKSEYWHRLVRENHYPLIKNSWLYSIDSMVRSIINGLHHRIYNTYKLWVDGYLKYHACTIMTKQQAYNYAETLNHAIRDMEKYQEKK